MSQTDDRRVALYVREGLPGPTRRRAEEVIEHLAKLARDGRFDEYDVYEWDRRIRRTGTDAPVSRDLFNEFSRWARQRGLGLTPFFGTRECYSAETGERGEWVVFPAMCLAVYEGTDLVAVYPHADGDEYVGVEDWFEVVDGDSEGEQPAGEPPVVAAE